MNLFKKDNSEIRQVNKLNQPHKGEKFIGIEPNLIVDLKNIEKIFVNENVQYKVIKNVDLQIWEGEFIVILGPSGSGKTTLMNIISGLERATNGVTNVLGNNLINFNGTELTTFRRENIGYIFQQYGLLPNLTVKDNILLGEYLQKKNYKFFTKKHKKEIRDFDKQYAIDLEDFNKKFFNHQRVLETRDKFPDQYESLKAEFDAIQNHKRQKIEKQYLQNINKPKDVENDYFLIDNIMKMLQIDNLAKKYPGQLSGGQQQRVSIARTLIKKPKILFADEPTGAVDTQMSKIIMKSLSEVNQIIGTTIVIVTHNPAIAEMADRVIHFFDGTISRIDINYNKKTVDQIKWE